MVLNQKHLSLAREKIESGLLQRVGGLDLIHRVSEHVRQGHSRGTKLIASHTSYRSPISGYP